MKEVNGIHPAVKRLLPLLALLLVACAPRQSAPSELPVTALDGAAYQQLVSGFEPVFQELGVTVSRASVYRYDGDQPGAFEQAINRFYRTYPKFCPLTSAFYPRGDDPVYMTVTANGREVRALVYDQAQRPKLTFAFLEGESREALSTVACKR